MLIVCPSCASEYRIDAAKVGMEGRSVRCAACRETWFLTPADVLAAQEAEFAAEAEAEPDPVSDAAWQEAAAAMRAEAEAETAPPEPPAPEQRGPAAKPRRAKPRRAKPPAKGRRAVPGLSPSLALGLAVLAALPLACLARAGVVRAVPQTAALYARIGLPVNLRGIEIRDVVAFSNPGEDGRPAELVVEGDLVGVGRGDVSVSALAVEVRDAAGRPLRTFPVPAPRAVLGAGETARFRASLTAPPEDGRAVELRFADAATPNPAARVASGH